MIAGSLVAAAGGKVAMISGRGLGYTGTTLQGKKRMPYVTDINQPLGNAVGNALEVKEAIEILGGQYEGDLMTVSCLLASRMFILGGIFATEN